MQHTPVSEAQRGVLTVLSKLGFDISKRNLDEYRKYYDSISRSDYINRVFEISNVKEVVMTNDPFDEKERQIWEKGYIKDSRFISSLRIDPLLNDFDTIYLKLNQWGYDVKFELDDKSIKEIKRFLCEWIRKTDSVYMAVSLPPSFTIKNDNTYKKKIIEKCVLPVCREFNIPFAMMIGVKRGANPKLSLAGDFLGKADVSEVEYLCREFMHNKFMITMLSKENQHELAILTRKFRNLMVFGCWWFLNNPSMIDEITRIRIETLGLSFIPQHSDSRVIDQLIYKWDHSKKVISSVLIDKYEDIIDSGWVISEEEIRRDVESIFSTNFWNFIKKKI